MFGGLRQCIRQRGRCGATDHGRPAGADSPCGHRHRHRPRRIRGRTDLRPHRTRPWIDSGIEKAVDDPLTLHSFGRLGIRLHAAEALLERAGRVSRCRAGRQQRRARGRSIHRRCRSARHQYRDFPCLNWQAANRRWLNMAWIATGAMLVCTRCTIRCAGSFTPSAITT